MLPLGQVVMHPSSISSNDPVKTKYLTLKVPKAVAKVSQFMGGLDITLVDRWVGQLVSSIYPEYHKSSIGVVNYNMS